MQLALFDQVDTPATLAPVPSSWCYIAHMFQSSGPAMWKLGYTAVSPLVRARQIACVPVAWWPGTMRDERRMHRQWKADRVSPAAEFFRHGHSLDRYVWQTIQQMPEPLRDRQTAVFAQIMLRLHEESQSYGGAA